MAIRQFKLNGPLVTPGSTGTIAMNGTQVFNGAFTGNGTLVETIAAGSVDVDNALASANVITVTTSITVTTGAIYCALFEWNYAPVPNPVYSAEQLAILTDPASTTQQRVAIYTAVAQPPLSEAETTILNQGTSLEARAILVQHNLTAYLQSASQYTWGLTQELCECNRTNVLINGVAPVGADTTVGILMTAGDVMTATELVFPSNLYPTTT